MPTVRYELQRIRGGNAKTRARPMPRAATLLPGFRKPQKSTLYAVSTWTERLEVYGYSVCVKHYVRVRNRLYTRVQLGTCAYKVTRKKVSSSFPVLSVIRIPRITSGWPASNSSFFLSFFLFLPPYRRQKWALLQAESWRVEIEEKLREEHRSKKERTLG